MRISTALKDLLPLAAFLMLSGQCASAQTIRGDFNMDGEIDISDVSSMIDCLLAGSLGEVTEAERDTVSFDGFSIVMIRVEGGGFYSRNFSEPKTVDHDFWIAQTEVTQGLWYHVMEIPESYPQPDVNERPLLSATWYECQEFISRLNEKTGRNFRLPVQQEWEYAALGGKLTKGYKYAGSDDINEVAWYIENHPDGVLHVATRAPNELGLYDMSGCAEEWCQDGYLGPENTYYYYVKGGSIYKDAGFCIPTSEFVYDGTQKAAGFRLAF